MYVNGKTRRLSVLTKYLRTRPSGSTFGHKEARECRSGRDCVAGVERWIRYQPETLSQLSRLTAFDEFANVSRRPSLTFRYRGASKSHLGSACEER